MAQAGAVAFSDDGSPVSNSRLMRNALAYSRVTGKPIVDHCEDVELVDGGVMHEGAVSSRLGLRGTPAESEEVAVARDLALARATGGRLHLAHLSTAAAIDLVRRARAQRVRVTAEVTPHHLTLTHEWVTGEPGGRTPFDTNCRVNPPLRTEEDRRALVAALLDGTIDAIATDHAPHTVVDKECEFDFAAPGLTGLETAFGLLMRLVHGGEIDVETVIRLLTAGPSKAFGLEAGTLAPGAPADIVVLDPDAEWAVDPSLFHSRGKNTPLAGQRLRGMVHMTIVNGAIVHEGTR
jgi:dihydroorotase